MKALRFSRFGGPEVLTVEDIASPGPDDHTAVIAVRAASVNPSDVANVAGRFPQTQPPRTPGRDYAGIVVEGPADWLGAEVWGTGDGGVSRDGTHAERFAVPVASLQRKPSRLGFDAAGSVGVTFCTAWIALAEYAGLGSGETAVVIGAAGAVGDAAVQLARWRGAKAIGVVRSAPPSDSAVARLADVVVEADPEKAAARVREVTGGTGAAVVFNTVGGPTFEPSLKMLALRGRLVVIASPGKPRQAFDLTDFYHNESRLFGADSMKRDYTAMARVLDALSPGFESGALAAARVSQRVSLGDAPAGYAKVAQGADGRIVLAPG